MGKTRRNSDRVEAAGYVQFPLSDGAGFALGLVALIAILILCLATDALEAWGAPPGTPPPGTEAGSHAASGLDLPRPDPSVPATLRPEQEAVALQQEELQLAQRFIDEFPGKADPLSIMANVLYRHGKASEALSFLEQARQISPRRTDIYIRMAELAFKQGELEETLAHYRRALDIQPQRPNVYSNVGNTLMMLGRYDEAVAALHRETRISPQASFAYFLLGQIYAQQGEYQKARESYEQAIRIKPRYANAYYGLVTVCVRLDQAEQAQVYQETFKQLKAQERKGQKGRKIAYEDAVETRKNAAITHISIGGIYRKIRKFDRAEAILKRAVRLDSENVVVYLELASLYQQQKQPAKALAMHQQVTALRPDSPLSYLMVGILSAHLRQYDAAERALEKMISLAPKKSDGYRELARLYLKTGKKSARARQLAQKAVALAPLATNHFVLGWAHYASGDHAQALSLVRQALEQDPDNLSYQRLYQTILQGR